MRLADDVYLLCHDDRTGVARVAPRVAGLGLAAGLLGELMLSGLVTVYRGGLYPVTGQDLPGDRLAREVLAVVSDGRASRDLGEWLRFLAVEAAVDVRRRLVTGGVLGRVRGRSLVGKARWTYPPLNTNQAAWPGIRLARLLTDGDPLTAQDAALVGLAGACGLLGRVLWDGDVHGPGWARADRVRSGLPPALSALAAHTTAAVADSVLTHTR